MALSGSLVLKLTLDTAASAYYGVYMPCTGPQSESDYIDTCCEIQEILNDHCDRDVILVGDMNASLHRSPPKRPRHSPETVVPGVLHHTIILRPPSSESGNQHSNSMPRSRSPAAKVENFSETKVEQGRHPQICGKRQTVGTRDTRH